MRRLVHTESPHVSSQETHHAIPAIPPGTGNNQARIIRAKAGDWHAWWLGLGIGFCILSIDEVAGMHECANTMMEDTP